MEPYALATDPAVLEVDRLRGHSFAPPVELLSQIPTLYATERTPLADKVVWLHYFVGACDWYVVELEHSSTLAFGYCSLGDPQSAEWGLVDLAELATLYVEPRAPESITVADNVELLRLHPHVVVERDLYWDRRAWRDVSLRDS